MSQLTSPPAPVNRDILARSPIPVAHPSRPSPSLIAITMPPRFLSTGAADDWRRYQRRYMRANGTRDDQRDRPGSRHKLYPCCGLRRQRCRCDWSSIESRLVSTQWASFTATFDSELLTLNDTQDCGPARRELAEAGIADGGRLWGLCAINRYFSNPALWDLLKGAGGVNLHRRSPIDVAKCQAVLEEAWASRSPVFGPGRRALALRSYLDAGGNWVSLPSATSKQRAERDAKCLQLLWQHRPGVQARALLARPSREAFAALMDAWSATLAQKLSGFDQYFTKCILDLFMPASGLPDEVVGWAWPTRCPGYLAAAAVLAPGLPKEELMKFLLWLHWRPASTSNPSQPTRQPATNLPTISSQRCCFDKRRKSTHPQACRRPTTCESSRRGRSCAGGTGALQGR